MSDKILDAKKDMKYIISKKGLTREEQYNQLKDRANTLTDLERKILLKECRREYASFDRASDIKELITIFLTGLGMFITIFSIFAQDHVLNYFQFSYLIVYVLAFVVFSVLVLHFFQTWRSKKMHIAQCLIDVLED